MEVKNKSSKVLNRVFMVLVTTVPTTIATILHGQPKFLSGKFDLQIFTSYSPLIHRIKEQEGVAVKIIPMVRSINVLKDFLSICYMVLILRRHRPEIIHSYTPKAGLVAMLAAWLCRVPVRVHTFTGLIFPTAIGFKQQILIWVDRLICQCATHIVPEGLGVKRDLERYRITKKPLNVIGHGNIAGVDMEYFNCEALDFKESKKILDAQLGMPSEAFVFCFVGRLNRDKGISELFEAFLLLPEKTHLLIVGDIDKSAPISKDLQLAMEKHPRVHTLGFMDDIRPALSLSDILVLPSYREGFPNVVLQAGAMRLPVIATDINGCNEVIEPGYNGWLVSLRDVFALQSAMREAMGTSEGDRKKMGLRARQRVDERFERHSHWKRMEQFYSDLLVNVK